ncbi:MAG: hypothetical protein ACTH2A_05240 [Glutamicibacter ardleyensis]
MSLLSPRATPHFTEQLKELESKVRQTETELVEGLNAEQSERLAHLLSELLKSIHLAQPGVNSCVAMDALG